MYFGNHASFSGFGLSMHIAKLNSKYHINRRLCCFLRVKTADRGQELKGRRRR